MVAREMCELLYTAIDSLGSESNGLGTRYLIELQVLFLPLLRQKNAAHGDTIMLETCCYDQQIGPHLPRGKKLGQLGFPSEEQFLAAIRKQLL